MQTKIMTQVRHSRYVKNHLYKAPRRCREDSQAFARFLAQREAPIPFRSAAMKIELISYIYFSK